MTKEDKEKLQELLEEGAKLNHEFYQLKQDLTGDEWLEVLRRDMEAEQYRRNHQAREYIRHAKDLIAKRPKP